MQRPLSVVFCGTPAFAVPSLQALIDDPAFQVNLVITQPDKPVGREKIVTPPPIKTLALGRGIPLFQPHDLNEEYFAAPQTKGVQPDFLVIVAYGQLLKQPLLSLPLIAPVNVHPSLLPRWRGASPIQHALLAGDRETGVTIQKVTMRLDSGPLLAQRPFGVSDRETAQTLHDRLSEEGAKLLIETLKKPLVPREQDASKATVCRKLTRADCSVDPATMAAEEIDRRVRALVPWPGVRCTIADREVKLLETSLVETVEAVSVPCAVHSTLYIVRLQPPGKKPMTGKEWDRGRR
ncbi:methionyl-tRNA formyltransferase [Candidatus Peribacteria bacterium RIFOXYC2_FULL_58_10]|nr:MAG: methionyl-tRNA formyltransferase [Candidatus Peribacteria bacterium RIFOXYC2_FULL_58_10]OGJ84581.1 MAG: methionyl-tRNA formyltransferase [Candidatus Peribacteria bacterium RIFOXYD2_FULL_58_15]